MRGSPGCLGTFPGLFSDTVFLWSVWKNSSTFGCNPERWGHKHCGLCQLRESVDSNTISPRQLGTVIFHTENNKILPRPRGNILKLFEVKENNCLLGQRTQTFPQWASRAFCFLYLNIYSDSLWVNRRVHPPKDLIFWLVQETPAMKNGVFVNKIYNKCKGTNEGRKLTHLFLLPWSGS